MASKNKFEVVNGNIHILKDGWKAVAEVTYREDYYRELTDVTWTVDNGYIKNSKLGYLHRYMMEKWYGKEILDKMTEKGWVVDHMNNNGFDCRISNLEFLMKRYNVAKGQTLDIEAQELRTKLALNIFKDFSTGFYQISIGFNEDICLWNERTKEYQSVSKLYLLYDCDYKLVINDAEQILLENQLEKKFGLGKLRFIDYKLEFPKMIKLTEKEKEEITNGNRWYIERDGEYYFVKGKNNWMIDAHYKEGWKI